MSQTIPQTFRVTWAIDVKTSSPERAVELARKLLPSREPAVSDVTGVDCCRFAQATRGWNHDTDCPNYVDKF